MKKRTIRFSGYEWNVKSAKRRTGPGPNYFCDGEDNVWIDKKGRLHLKITKSGSRWNCAEVFLKESLGYGKYIFEVAANPNELDKNAVAGFFTYLDNNNEVDIEFARWGRFEKTNAQFTVQPWHHKGSIKRFNINRNIIETTNLFEWKNKRVFFQTISKGKNICNWLYKGKDNPKKGGERARINLWLFHAKSPEKNREQEITVKKFRFIPSKK